MPIVILEEIDYNLIDGQRSLAIPPPANNFKN